MIKILKNYIGLKHIADEPTSGILVNSLPGISTRQLYNISSEEHETLAEAWQDIENNAIRGFESDLLNALKKHMKHYTDVLDVHFGNFQVSEILPASDEYLGYNIDVKYISPNLKIILSRVSFNLLADQEFDLKIFDLSSGNELFTKTVSGKAGHNTVLINETFESTEASQLFVAVNNINGGFVPVKANTRKFCSFQSSTLAQPVNGGLLKKDMAPFGISFVIACSLENYVTTRLSFFTQSFLYRVGMELAKERQHSERINRYTLLNNKQAEELQDQLENDYKESMKGVLTDLKAPEDGFCFSCNQALTRVYRTP